MPEVRLSAMLLSVALFTLFMMGFWLYCLTDAILTRASEFRGRAAPKGPDDDPEFLRALDRQIHGNSQAGEEV
jgi:hypothetical protein